MNKCPCKYIATSTESVQVHTMPRGVPATRKIIKDTDPTYKATRAQYYTNNKEAISAQNKNYYEANKEKLKRKRRERYRLKKLAEARAALLAHLDEAASRGTLQAVES